MEHGLRLSDYVLHCLGYNLNANVVLNGAPSSCAPVRVVGGGGGGGNSNANDVLFSDRRKTRFDILLRQNVFNKCMFYISSKKYILFFVF